MAPSLVAMPAAEQLLAAFEGPAGGAEQLVSDVITEALAGNVEDADVNALLEAALPPQVQDLASMGDGLFQSNDGPANLSMDAFGPLGMSGAHQMVIVEMMAVQPDAFQQA